METAKPYRLATHQLDGITMMEYNDALALFYEAGTGKTATALGWASNALRDHVIQGPVLVICPAPLVGKWYDDVKKMDLFDGFSREDVDRLRKAVFVTSFQKLYRTEKHLVNHRDGRTTEVRSIRLREEIDRRWGAVIIDESHSLGGHSSVQTKVCLTIAHLTDHRYILSGTPVAGGKGKEDFEKIYGQLKFLDPGLWNNWSHFCRDCVEEMDKWHKPAVYKVDHCRELMKQYGIVCRLEDCFDMPETTETVIKCPLTEKAAYRDILRGKIEKYNIEVSNAGGQYLKLLQLCSGSIKCKDGSVTKYRTSKEDALRTILDGTMDKVCIFCQYTASVDRVVGLCREWGYKVTQYDGRSGDEDWKEFQYGDSEIIVAQYQRGGTGLDLFTSATMVFWEPTTSSRLLIQTKARIFRKGQTRPCSYYFLCTPSTIEELVLYKVRRGEEVTGKMLDDWAAESNNGATVIEDIHIDGKVDLL